MARNTVDRRRFHPSKLWVPLFELNQAHLQEIIDIEQVSTWREKQQVWTLIFSNLRQQEEGQILETERIFGHIRFCEALAQDNDRFFRLAAALLSRPVHEDLIERGGLHEAIEDLFLKKYGFAPRISKISDKMVNIRFPKVLYRLFLRYPSPKRVRRDFEELTKGIWGLEFGTRVIGKVLYFGVGLPPLDEGPSDSEFVREAKAMIKQVEGVG